MSERACLTWFGGTRSSSADSRQTVTELLSEMFFVAQAWNISSETFVCAGTLTFGAVQGRVLWIEELMGRASWHHAPLSLRVHNLSLRLRVQCVISLSHTDHVASWLRRELRSTIVSQGTFAPGFWKVVAGLYPGAYPRDIDTLGGLRLPRDRVAMAMNSVVPSEISLKEFQVKLAAD